MLCVCVCVCVCVCADGTLSLDVKASMGHLFVPEETSKVAHGDENLSVEDFLARASGLKA